MKQTANKKFLLATLAIALAFATAVVGCETEPEKGPLEGTTWSRVVNSFSSTMTIHYVFELTFIDASNAKVRQTGYTQQSGKQKNNIDTTAEYTYTYDSKANADGWQGALTPKSSSNIGYVFKISGNTLTTWTASGAAEWTKD